MYYMLKNDLLLRALKGETVEETKKSNQNDCLNFSFAKNMYIKGMYTFYGKLKLE